MIHRRKMPDLISDLGKSEMVKGGRGDHIVRHIFEPVCIFQVIWFRRR